MAVTAIKLHGDRANHKSFVSKCLMQGEENY